MPADLPPRLIGDRGYDSDPLDQPLTSYGIDMMQPSAAGAPARRTGARSGVLDTA